MVLKMQASIISKSTVVSVRCILLVQVSRFAAGIVAGAVDVRAAGGSRYGILEPGRTALG